MALSPDVLRLRTFLYVSAETTASNLVPLFRSESKILFANLFYDNPSDVLKYPFTCDLSKEKHHFGGGRIEHFCQGGGVLSPPPLR